MSGAGPAGELTFADVRKRLRSVLAAVTAMEAGHEAEAAEVAESRQPPETVEIGDNET